jgi:hypothetical protein
MSHSCKKEKFSVVSNLRGIDMGYKAVSPPFEGEINGLFVEIHAGISAREDSRVFGAMGAMNDRKKL